MVPGDLLLQDLGELFCWEEGEKLSSVVMPEWQSCCWAANVPGGAESSALVSPA